MVTGLYDEGDTKHSHADSKGSRQSDYYDNSSSYSDSSYDSGGFDGGGGFD